MREGVPHKGQVLDINLVLKPVETLTLIFLHRGLFYWQFSLSLKILQNHPLLINEATWMNVFHNTRTLNQS